MTKAPEGDLLAARLESVQSLRGIAALFVVSQHICFIGRGSFGVDIFFLISGFIIMLSTEKGREHFLVKRLIRIVPLYYLFTFVSFLAAFFIPALFDNTKADVISLVKSLLFIPFEQSGVTQPLYRIGWTINYEVMFYLLFFISMLISFRFRAIICTLLICLLAGLGALFPNLPEPARFWTDSIILEFAVGMLSYYLIRFWYGKVAEKEKTSPLFCKICVIIGMIACVSLFLFMYKSYENSFLCSIPEFIRWGLPSFVIFLIFLRIGFTCSFPGILVLLGNMSFSIYMIHYFPMRFLGRIIGNTMNPNTVQVFITLGMVALSLACAYLSYILIEKKFTKYLKNKLEV